MAPVHMANHAPRMRVRRRKRRGVVRGFGQPAMHAPAPTPPFAVRFERVVMDGGVFRFGHAVAVFQPADAARFLAVAMTSCAWPTVSVSMDAAPCAMRD